LQQQPINSQRLATCFKKEKRMSGPASAVSRTTPQLYRDCLRLVVHIAGNSKKARNIKSIVRSEFRKNAGITDPVHIEALKSNAVRGLANYLMIKSIDKDAKFKERSAAYVQSTLDSIEADEKKK
jgi:molybdenum cofactor biosynthesis enzyme